MKLRPVDFATNGVFLAGLAHWPKFIDETIAQASGAAARAMTIISKEFLETQGIIAAVNDDVCDGCGVCEPVCEYKAITIVADPKNPGEAEGRRQRGPVQGLRHLRGRLPVRCHGAEGLQEPRRSSRRSTPRSREVKVNVQPTDGPGRAQTGRGRTVRTEDHRRSAATGAPTPAPTWLEVSRLQMPTNFRGHQDHVLGQRGPGVRAPGLRQGRRRRPGARLPPRGLPLHRWQLPDQEEDRPPQDAAGAVRLQPRAAEAGVGLRFRGTEVPEDDQGVH